MYNDEHDCKNTNRICAIILFAAVVGIALFNIFTG